MSGDPAPAAATARIVNCPACDRPTAFTAANRFRPFCSERCRQADLGGWATESYRIPVQPGDDEDGNEVARADPDPS